MLFHGDDPRAGRRQLQRLAAGRGAEVNDLLVLHIAQQQRGQAGGGILHPPASLIETMVRSSTSLRRTDAARMAEQADAFGMGGIVVRAR